MNILNDSSVRTNPDGTYTIADGPEFPGHLRGEWTIRDTGQGWEAVHPHDGFDGDLFASAVDAATAVLGDPADARRWER